MRVSMGPPARISVQRHGRVAVGLHQRGGGQHRHRRLAHGKHVHVAAEEAEHVAHGVDVVVEVEAAGLDRHVARVLPVGDVDLVVGQEGLDRAAQQRGEVSDMGATSSRRGFCAARAGSMSRLKWTRRQNGVLPHDLPVTRTEWPATLVLAMPNSGLSSGASRARTPRRRQWRCGRRAYATEGSGD